MPTAPASAQIVTLTRSQYLADRCLGRLTHEGKAVCCTLEDLVRPAGQFVAGKTAIAAGLYEVIVTRSPRMQRLTAVLLGVPHHADGLIRIHAGENPDDSLGCVLTGLSASNHQLDGCHEAEAKVTALFTALRRTGKTYLRVVNA